MESTGQRLWKLLDRCLRFIVYKIFHLKISEDNWGKFLQFVKFGIVGLSNTVISYVIYVIALLFFQRGGLFPSVDYLISHVIAFVLSVLWSFYWNRKYVFEADDDCVPWPKALLKTYISYAFTGLFLNSVLSILWVQRVGIPKLFAPIINLLVSVPINFVLNKFWAFRSKN